MSKPTKLKDLMIGGHIGVNDINAIARAMFTNATTMAGPEGYLVTGVNFDDLPEHVRGYIRKAIKEFSVENVLDANAANDVGIDDDDAPVEDGDSD